MESGAVSKGTRAPNFEVFFFLSLRRFWFCRVLSFFLLKLPEPLTGKTHKLEDFEPYPALLVSLILEIYPNLSSLIFNHPHC